MTPVASVTVTEDVPRCAWCRRRLPPAAATGRPRRYCRRSCRQRAFEARRRLDELSWGEDRLHDLLRRQDDVSVAAQALADVVEEMRADVDDGRDWDPHTRQEHVERLEAVVADLVHDATTPRDGTPPG